MSQWQKSRSLLFFHPDYEGNKAENRKRSKLDRPLTVDYFQNNRTINICVILLTNRWNTSFAEVKIVKIGISVTV